MLETRPPSRPAAFLDRDGVINIDTGYPHRPDELRLTQSAARGIARLNEAGYLVIVVTNQSGVARGLFGMDEVDEFHAELRRVLSAQGAAIDAFYVAPFHPDGTVPAFAIDHPDRKPGDGMIRRAMADWRIDAARSFLIGDKPTDMEAATRAGIRGVPVATDMCDLYATVSSLVGQTATPC